MAGELAPRARGAGNTANEAGQPPIGSIIAWNGSQTGVPVLPECWIECNGQTITHTSSPMKGQTAPNINGSNQFVRGNSASNTTAAQTTATQTVQTTGASTSNITYVTSAAAVAYFNARYVYRIF